MQDLLPHLSRAAELHRTMIRLQDQHGAVIRSISQHRPSLEDLFMEAVGEPEGVGADIAGKKKAKTAKNGGAA